MNLFWMCNNKLGMEGEGERRDKMAKRYNKYNGMIISKMK